MRVVFNELERRVGYVQLELTVQFESDLVPPGQSAMMMPAAIHVEPVQAVDGRIVRASGHVRRP